jgi:sugar/nucleoside kinase (ribokinase family)
MELIVHWLNLIQTDGVVVDVPAFEVDVVDTVGAGDSFDAGFLSALLEGANPQDAGCFAAATAALTCTGRGPLEKMPRRNDVLEFLRQQPGLSATLHALLEG